MDCELPAIPRSEVLFGMVLVELWCNDLKRDSGPLKKGSPGLALGRKNDHRAASSMLVVQDGVSVICPQCWGYLRWKRVEGVTVLPDVLGWRRGAAVGLVHKEDGAVDGGSRRKGVNFR